MKRRWLLLLTLLMALLCSAAGASSQVSFEGGAERFVFLPGSEYSQSDLFEGFKNVLPGDVLTQRITIRNDSAGAVRIYLRAEPVDEGDRALLRQLRLRVEGPHGVISDAAASGGGQLAQRTFLGTFGRGGSTELLLTLTVPIELDNAFMDAMGTVAWTFVAEEVVEDDSPHTGDDFNLAGWLAAAGVLLVAICLSAWQLKRKN